MKLVNKSKRVLAMLVCALLVVLSVVPTMATTGTKKGETSTFTIKNSVSGHTYKLYQLLKGDVSGLNIDGGTGTLSNVEKGDQAVAGKTAEEIYTLIENKTGEELGKTAWSLVKTGATPKYMIDGTGSNATKEVENGYYVIEDTYSGSQVTDGSNTISRYIVAVAGDTTVAPKSDFPTVDKKIVDTDANKSLDDYGKTDTAAIGDTIEYEVTGKLPDMTGYTYYYYYITDTMSKGLTLVDDYVKSDSSKTGGFTVTIGNTTLVRGTDYHVYKDGQEFKLTIVGLKQLAKDNSWSKGTSISIKYNALVNENAKIGTDANTNTVHLNYSNNPNTSDQHDDTNKPGIPDNSVPTGIGPNKVTKTYVTELTLNKVDTEGNALNGAEFTLVGDNLKKLIVNTNVDFVVANDGTYYKLKTGVYTETQSTTDTADKYVDTNIKYKRVVTTEVETADERSHTIVATVDDSGRLTFTGLNAGTYTLKETKTPEGYSTMKDETITISATQGSANAEVGGDITWMMSVNDPATITDINVSTDGKISANVVNTKGNVLPSTGGIGTRIFYIIGGLLMAAAAVVLITKVRFNKNK